MNPAYRENKLARKNPGQCLWQSVYLHQCTGASGGGLRGVHL